MESSGKRQQVEVGFAGGPSIALRIDEDAYKTLRDALRDGDGKGWIEIEAEDAQVQIDARKVVFVRLAVDRGRVGFFG